MCVTSNNKYLSQLEASRQQCQCHNEKTMTRYTANGMLPAQHLHKACARRKHKHFHEVIQVSLFTHKGI
jgi:hypothetical protein